MSLLLRHKPETIGITLDEHGWADVEKLQLISELINNLRIAATDVFIVINEPTMENWGMGGV